MNASDLIQLSAPPLNHLSDWDAITWFGYSLAALVGWGSMAWSVFRVFDLEMKWRTQKPTPLVATGEYVVVVCSVLGGAILGGAFGLIVERHMAGSPLMLFWLALPFICGGVVLIYWHRWLKPGVDEANLKELLANLNALAAYPNAVAEALAAYPNAVTRSRTDSAAWIVAFLYAAVGFGIATVDGINRLAAEVALPTDTIIVLVLIGILGWVFWVYFPRRRRARRG